MSIVVMTDKCHIKVSFIMLSILVLLISNHLLYLLFDLISHSYISFVQFYFFYSTHLYYTHLYYTHLYYTHLYYKSLSLFKVSNLIETKLLFTLFHLSIILSSVETVQENLISSLLLDSFYLILIPPCHVKSVKVYYMMALLPLLLYQLTLKSFSLILMVDSRLVNPKSLCVEL